MRLVGRIDRYLLRELAGPFLLGFLVYTFIMLVQFFFRSTEMIIRRGVPPSQVGELLLYYLPSIIVLTLPMALLFGILVAVGRLAGDSELTALRAGGISLWRITRPFLALSLLLSAFNAYLMLELLPRGNSALQDLQARILTSSIARQVDARVFYEEWQGLVLYVFEVSPDDDRWHGVFLANTDPRLKGEISWAETARVRVDRERGNELVLTLENVTTHQVQATDPDNYHTSRYRSLERIVEDPFSGDKEEVRRRRFKQLRELTLPELRERIADRELPSAIRRIAKVEIHKKFSIPLACLVFGLLGPPLAFHRRRSGKGSGFAMSIAVIMAYWFLITAGERAAREDLAPWLAMWLPNAVFLVAGLALLLRKNRDRGLLPHRLDYWLRSVGGAVVHDIANRLQNRESRRRARGRGVRRRAAGDATQFVLRVPQLRVRLLSRLDRYVLALFLKIFAFVLLTALVLVLVGQLTDKIDEIATNQIPAATVFAYLRYSILQPLYEAIPVAVLVSTLTAFGILSQRNEVMAVKALGISLYRLAVPAVLGATLVVALSTILQRDVLPAANEKTVRLEDEIHAREKQRTYRRGDRNWLFGADRFVYNYLSYDQSQKSLRKLQVFELSPGRGIERRLYAERAVFVGDAWRFEDTWTRSFDGLETVEYHRFATPALVDFPETPEYFEGEVKEAQALGYSELKRYIAELEASGQAVPELRVALYDKFSYPAVSLVMALVALPFSFRLGRRGALYGIGIGILLGMVFLGTVAFCTALGKTGALPPMLAVWTPTIAFSLLSLYAFLGVET